MRTLRAPRSAISSRPAARSSSSTNSWPTSASASCWFGETRYGSASTASRSGSPSESTTASSWRAVQLADELAVEAGVDRPRQRAGRARRTRPAGRGRRASRAGSASSSSVTSGPHSLISVYAFEVGSRTAIDVRDSPRIRTKSLRIPSFVSSSTSSVPVRPPARPVQTTGAPRRLRARATLIPLPPALGKPTLARCRWPGWKFGTDERPVDRRVERDGDDHPTGCGEGTGAILADSGPSEARDRRGEDVAGLVEGPVSVPADPLLAARARRCPASPPGRPAPPPHRRP